MVSWYEKSSCLKERNIIFHVIYFLQPEILLQRNVASFQADNADKISNELNC